MEKMSNMNILFVKLWKSKLKDVHLPICNLKFLFLSACARTEALTTPEEYELFKEHYKLCMTSQIKGVNRRKKGKILSVDEYMVERMNDAGILWWVTTQMICERVTIPTKLLENENFKVAKNACLHVLLVPNVKIK